MSATTRALFLTLLMSTPLAGAAEVRVQVPDKASEVGRWLRPMEWPMGPSHAAVLATGKVLLFGPPDEHSGLIAKLWNPATGGFQDVPYDHHIHCSGHSFLADGSLYVTGGHDHELCPVQGRDETNLFDPFSESWSPMAPMRFARYYPTNLTLGDGRVLIVAGLGERCQFLSRAELYVPGKGVRLVKEVKRRLDLYPMVHLLPSGEIAHVGPEAFTTLLDLEAETWRRLGTHRYREWRYSGNSFLVPGKPFNIMICGGFERLNHGPTETCETIGFGGSEVTWRTTAPMHFPRGHANAVILPDKTVVVVGGGGDGFFDDPVYNAELFNPETETWRLAPPQRYVRMHHSVAVLLPDGRVLSASEPPHRDEQDDEHQAVNGTWAAPYPAEIYQPPYLFRGPRPVIRRAPGQAAYGSRFEIRVQQAKRIRSVVLVRPSAVTHSRDTDQRLVELDFRRLRGKRLEIGAPQSPHRAPPGYYMLFALNERGVPSKAKMVQLLPQPGD